MNTQTLPTAARLLSLEGDAWLQGSTPRPLAVNSEVEAGQVLATGPRGHVHLLLASGHELDIGPNQLLCLDDDVLANADADAGEWRLSGLADTALLAAWLQPALPALDHLLVAPSLLDELFGPAAAIALNDHTEPRFLMAGADADLNQLLRSLYGPDVF